MTKTMTATVLTLVTWACCLFKIEAQVKTPTRIRGRVMDSASLVPLPGVTVTVKQLKSSKQVTAITSENGFFEITLSLPPGEYLLHVNAGGYIDKESKIILTAKAGIMQLPVIYLVSSYRRLQDVVVKTAPVIELAGDTVSARASQFHLPPNAQLDDLLKKIPGIEVDRQGKITAMGQKVERVLLNGKRVFDNGAADALKSLAPEMVEKIQVYSGRSDESTITGIDDGSRIATLNIITKSNLPQSFTGRVSAAAGTAGSFENAFNAQRLRQEQVLLAAGEANNTGAAQSQEKPQTGGGVSTVLRANINYADLLGKATRFTGSYTAGSTRLESAARVNQENFIPGDSSIFISQQQNGKNTQATQRGAFTLNSQMDSLNLLTALGTFSYARNENISSSNSISSKGTRLLNTTQNALSGKGHDLSTDLKLIYSHRFLNPRRRLSLRFGGMHTESENDARNRYHNSLGSADSVFAANQLSNTQNGYTGFTAGIFYSEPVSATGSLLLSVDYSTSHSGNNQYTTSYDSLKQQYMPDSLLSNNFKSTWKTTTAGTSYVLARNGLMLMAGISGQQGSLTGNNTWRGSSVKREFFTILPVLSIRVNDHAGRYVELQYSGAVASPDAKSLDPVPVNTDPLHIRMGNTQLKQGYTHKGMINFRSAKRKKLLAAMAGGSLQVNGITSYTITSLSTGIDTTAPVNVNGNYNLFMNISYSFPIFPGMNMTLGGSLQHNHAKGFINAVPNTVNTYGISETVKLSSNFKKNLDINLSYLPQQNFTHNPQQSQLNTKYFLHAVLADATWYTKHGLLLSSGVRYNGYTGRAAGFNTSIMLCNAAVGYMFLRHQHAEIRFSVNDLLNRNKAITRTVTATGITDSENRVIGRYCLLRLLYNFRDFKHNRLIQ